MSDNVKVLRKNVPSDIEDFPEVVVWYHRILDGIEERGQDIPVYFSPNLARLAQLKHLHEKTFKGAYDDELMMEVEGDKGSRISKVNPNFGENLRLATAIDKMEEKLGIAPKTKATDIEEPKPKSKAAAARKAKYDNV